MAERVYLLFFYFWFLWQIKSILFSLYLWQLKEYHLGRFIDHFRTEKGKRIFKNPVFAFKIFLLILIFLSPCFLYLLVLFYFLLVGKFILDLLMKRELFPIFTKKILLLSLLAIFLSLLFGSLFISSPSYLLIFDILNLPIFSGIVLIFQPFSAFFRYFLIFKAKKKRERFKDLIVIGICGSFGKTSTKEFLAKILEEKFSGKILKTKEHQNSEVAISRTILEDLNENQKIFIAEMGAYNKGGISLLAKMAKPKIGVITGLNEQHLALFGSMENLISAEGGRELIESLPEDGIVIFNGENEILRKIYQETKIKKRIVSLEREGDLWAENTKVEKERVEFEIVTKEGEREKISLTLIGKQNVINFLLAAMVARELGLSVKEISRGAPKIKMEDSGVLLKRTNQGIFLVDATYSSNPDAVFSHLDYLKAWERKKFLIMPCLIELGSASKEIHRKIGEKIFEVCDLAIVTTKEKFKEIKETAKEKAIFLENPKEISKFLKTICQSGDIILLEGRIDLKIKQFLME